MPPILFLQSSECCRFYIFFKNVSANTMKVVHVSYVCLNTIVDPDGWLNQIGFFTGILEKMAQLVQVESIHCINADTQLTRNSVRYHFLKLEKGAALTGINVSRYLASLKPDVVIVHGLSFPLQVLLLQRILSKNVKMYFQHHAERPLRFPKSILQSRIDSAIRGYFFTAKALAQPWVDAKQIRSLNKVHEVMEVSSDLHPVKLQSADVRKGNYLWVGRLDSNKDPITLMKAFLEFLDVAPHASLYAVYRGGKLSSQVKTILAENPGRNRIVLIENVDHLDLVDWYSRCGFIISTSHYEGSGTAVCEAMAFGCVPVLSNIPSFHVMTAAGTIGYLFDPGSVGSLRDALINTQSCDFEEITRQVTLQYHANLSFDAIARKIVTIIT
jgi:glycosyltransferase involved in cell wall biosynthesis